MTYNNLIEVLEADNANTKIHEMDILDRYNKAVLKYSEKDKQSSPINYFRPSSLAGGCKRMLYYQRTGAKEDKEDKDDEWTINLKGITNTGTHRHEVIQNIVEEMEGVRYLERKEIEELIEGTETEIVYKDGKEYRFKNDRYNIYFQPDGIIEIDGELVLLEIKTTSIFNWGKIKEPMEKHIEQANIYASCLGIDSILFMYEDRNFTRMKIYIEETNKDIQNKIVRRIEDVEKALKNNTPPTREEDKCQYCRYKEICKGG